MCQSACSASLNDGGAHFRDRSAFTLLRRLELDGPMSIGQLSDAFGLDTSTPPGETDDVETLAHLLHQFNLDIENRDGRRWPRPGPGPAA